MQAAVHLDNQAQDGRLYCMLRSIYTLRHRHLHGQTMGILQFKGGSWIDRVIIDILSTLLPAGKIRSGYSRKQTSNNGEIFHKTMINALEIKSIRQSQVVSRFIINFRTRNILPLRGSIKEFYFLSLILWDLENLQQAHIQIQFHKNLFALQMATATATKMSQSLMKRTPLEWFHHDSHWWKSIQQNSLTYPIQRIIII